MALYRKKPVDVEAVQWTGDNAEDVWRFADKCFYPEHFLEYPRCVAGIYDELHGTWIRVKLGDWVLKGVRGEFYPCDEGVFAETYELVCDG